jgi:hypothetical protein
VTLKPTAGLSRGQIIGDFDRRILEHQPLAYLKAVADDILYSFSPVRGDGPEKYPTWYHDFHTRFIGDKDEIATIPEYTGSRPHADHALAGFLSGYGRDFYVPGPVLALGLALGLAGMAGMAGIGRARRSHPRRLAAKAAERAPCLLFALGAIAVVEPPFIIAAFDWRYELPQFSLIPVAAILAVTAFTRSASTQSGEHVQGEAGLGGGDALVGGAAVGHGEQAADAAGDGVLGQGRIGELT